MGPGRDFELGPVKLRINWLIFACVILTASAFIQLGLWQVGRAEEKLAAQEEFEARQLLNATSIDDIPQVYIDSPGENLTNLHIALQGEYDNDRAILVTAQFFDGQIGYEVITPFRQQGSNRLILLSRGWTTGILPPNTPPMLRPVTGKVELTAQIYVPEPNERVLSSQIDASQWPLRIRSVEVDVLESLFREPLFPFVARLTENQPGMLVRHWPVTNTSITNNLSYAFQWFLFAAIVILASLAASTNLISLMRDPEGQKFRK